MLALKNECDLQKTNVKLKTNFDLKERTSSMNKKNVELEKRMSVLKTNDKLNFDRKNAPYTLPG